MRRLPELSLPGWDLAPGREHRYFSTVQLSWQGRFHQLPGWSLAQDVLDAVIRWWISDKRVFLLPAAPPALQALGVCSTGRFKTFLQKVRDFFSSLTALIKTGVPLLRWILQVIADF